MLAARELAAYRTAQCSNWVVGVHPSSFRIHSVHAGDTEQAPSISICVHSYYLGADRYRRLLDRLEDEDELRKLAVGELAHRLKNKIATIQSVIDIRLRDDPQTRNAILSLLNSLSATDDLIMATQGKGANFHS